MDNFYARYPVTGGGVTSLNGETGAITLVGGTDITITPSGQNITISSTGQSTTLTNAHIWVGNAINMATDVPVSGDLSLVNTGAFTIVPLAVTNGKIADATIDLTTKVTNILPIANGGTGSATTSQNFAFIGPTSGSGAPSFRLLTSGDIPALPYANTALSNLASTAVNDNIIPDSAASHNLGALGFAWNQLFVLALADNAGVTSVDVANRQLVDSAAISTVDWSAAGMLKIMADVHVTPVGGSASSIFLFDNAADFSARVKAPASISANTLFQLPPDNGTNGFSLQTNGSGVTSWAAQSTATNNKETFVLTGTDITNQYVDLAHVAKTNSVNFMVKGAGSLLEGASYDYSVSYTGGAGGNTRITFLNDLATGGLAALIAGDVVQVQYEY